jgi:hypothetical protein
MRGEGIGAKDEAHVVPVYLAEKRNMVTKKGRPGCFLCWVDKFFI